MHESYADVLESHLIPAEEGVIDTIKNTYKTVKNSNGVKVAGSIAAGIGTAYGAYTITRDIGKTVKNSILSSKVEEVERFIKNKLLGKYGLTGKFKLISEYNPDNTTICDLVSPNNISEDSESKLHDLLSELKKNYRFVKYRIGSTEDYEVLVRLYY